MTATMKRTTFIRFVQSAIAACTAAACMAGCSAPAKLSPEHLDAIGVREGASYWVAQQKLAREGYQCFVTGAKRENFDCTKTEGFFPTCVLRVEFKVNDENAISKVRVADPACIGTP